GEVGEVKSGLAGVVESEGAGVGLEGGIGGDGPGAKVGEVGGGGFLIGGKGGVVGNDGQGCGGGDEGEDGIGSGKAGAVGDVEFEGVRGDGLGGFIGDKAELGGREHLAGVEGFAVEE